MIDKEQADAKAKADLELERRQSAAREAAAREEARKAAEAVAAEKFAAAEQALVSLQAQILQQRQDSETALATAKARETEIRTQAQQAAEAAAAEKLAASESARLKSEAALQARIAQAEETKVAADKAVADAQAKIAEAEGKLSKLSEQREITLNERLGSLREVMEKAKDDAIKAEKAKAVAEHQKLTSDFNDLKRKYENKTPAELGEGAELELFELLKAAFPDDRIWRVEKGAMGADIIHEVVENGKVCGKIVYDRKNRGNWKTEYATKLHADQIAEKADRAILSTNKYPDGEDQICMREHVILACPARVRWLAELLRGLIIFTHKLRVSNEARDEKTAEVYAFITSQRCRQLLDSIETLVKKLEEIEVAEEKAHRRVWINRGELLKSVLKANGVFCFEIDRIIGTAADDEVALEDLNDDQACHG